MKIKITDFLEFERCSKTGKIKKIRPKRSHSKFIFSCVGIVSTIWVLHRVITKPTRINYPCVQAAVPFASTFWISIITSIASYLAFSHLKEKFKFAKYLAIVSMLAFFSIMYFSSPQEKIVYANTYDSDIPNQPIGEAKGVIPGRVVWVHEPDATNENWHNNLTSRYYHQQNYSLEIIEKMVDEAIVKLTESENIGESWEKIFLYFNDAKGKGERSYEENEKIFIKINTVGTGWNSTNSDFELNRNKSACWTSPPVILSILRHLIDHANVPQENIYLGDPMHVVIKEYHDLFSSRYPNVNYVSNKSGSGAGRVRSIPSTNEIIFYSDSGAVLRTGNPDSWNVGNEWGDPVYSDAVYQAIEEADYLINMAALKTHERGGVTLCAKNHYGSHTRENAKQLHMGLVSPNQTGYDDPVARFDYGMYRVLVDLMGHEKLGRNTLLFFVDGLWGGTGAGRQPEKYRMAPFNNDYPSSIFVSMDNVAIESVCLDILKAEFTQDNPYTSSPQMPAVDDYLKQAADSSYWPEGFVYDPEGDGTPIPSLGVHEHWNNSTDMQYSVNLGSDHGIELIKIEGVLTGIDDESYIPAGLELSQNYPNPFNPATVIQYYIQNESNVNIKLYDNLGRYIATLVNKRHNRGSYKLRFDAAELSSGTYIYALSDGENIISKKMILIK